MYWDIHDRNLKMKLMFISKGDNIPKHTAKETYNLFQKKKVKLQVDCSQSPYLESKQNNWLNRSNCIKIIYKILKF